MSTTFAELVIRGEADLKRRQSLEQQLSVAKEELSTLSTEHLNTLQAQQLLSLVSEENTVKTLDFITTVLNKVLADIFQGSIRRVYLEKKLHQGRYAHIVVKLEDGNGNQRDLKLQTGSGIKEVLSFLFTCCFIAVRGGRKLLIFDEVLSGLHPDAIAVVEDLMVVFVNQGFQFMFVGYSMDNRKVEGELQPFGRIYNVENPQGTGATVAQVEGIYTGARFSE